MSFLKAFTDEDFKGINILIIIVAGTWLVIGIFMLLGNSTIWNVWEGWLTWGRDLVFVSILPYLGKKISEGLRRDYQAPRNPSA